jgi:hypothetical protein
MSGVLSGLGGMGSYLPSLPTAYRRHSRKRHPATFETIFGRGPGWSKSVGGIMTATGQLNSQP